MLKLRAIFSRKGTIKKKHNEDQKAAPKFDEGEGLVAAAANILQFSELNNDFDDPSDSNGGTLQPCSICGRTFAPSVLPRHTTACEKLATTAAKRKTFDSSKQRTEGTGMEQFKSSPTSSGSKLKTPVLKKRPSVAAAVNTSTLSMAPALESRPATENNSGSVSVPSGFLLSSVQTTQLTGRGACPHCDRIFNQRALDRHVDWCSTKSQRPTPTRNGAAEVALQRLHARTRYRPPSLGRARKQHATQNTQRVQHTPQHAPQNSLQHAPQQALQQAEYDPYKSAAVQMKRLMASQMDLTALPVQSAVASASDSTLDVVLVPKHGRYAPKALSHPVESVTASRGSQNACTLLSGGSMRIKHVVKSPQVERRNSNANAKNNSRQAANTNKLNTLTLNNNMNKFHDKYVKKPDTFNMDLFLGGYQEAIDGSDYIDPRLINRKDNLPVDIDTDILRSSDSLLSNENLPREFQSFTVQSNNRSLKNTNEKKKNSSIDSLNRQYDDIMHSLETSINNKLNRINGGVDLEDLISDFDRELAACGGGGSANGMAADSDGNQPSGETDEERTGGSKVSQDSAYNSLRRSRRGDGDTTVLGGPRAPRGARNARPRRVSTDSSTPSSTESAGICAVDSSTLLLRAGTVTGGITPAASTGRPARFCHECGCCFPPPPSAAHYCASCGAKRLVLATS